MPLRQILIALMGLSLIAVPQTASAQLLNFRQYTSAEGLPQSQVIDIMQDRDGYIWFATYGGLTRYNGKEFRTWTKRDGLASNSVFDISQDSSGRLHLATSRGLCTMADGAFSCIDHTNGLIDQDTRLVRLDRNGGIWVGTGRGLSHVNGKTIRNYTVNDGLPADRITRIVRDSSERLWVATTRGLARLEGDHFVQVGRELIGNEPVQVLVPSGQGLIVGSQGRLFSVNGNDVKRSPASDNIPDSALFVDGAMDRQGALWIGMRSGALRIRSSQVDLIGPENGLPKSTVLRVFVDRENNVWFGTENGASKHVPGPFRTYTMNEGLPGPFVRAIEVDSRGRLWIGGRNGIAVREGERFRPIPLSNVPDQRVYALAAVGDGLLIGTRIGLVWYRDGHTTLYREQQGLPGEVIFSIVKDRNGVVWLGTDRGLAKWVDGRVETVPLDGLPPSSIIAMAIDHRERLWLGLAASGVAIVDSGRVQVINADSGATDQTIWSMQEDSRGNMWIGTNGDGVLQVSDTAVRAYTTQDGLASDFIWQVLADAEGDVWVFGNLGIDRFSNGRWIHYGRGSGLIELEGAANAVKQDAEGNRWFGTGAGIVRYSAHSEVAVSLKPPAKIEGASVDGTPIAIGGNERIRIRQGEVRIRFSSPHYRDEGQTRFTYRLMGMNTSWSEPTTEASLTYAGLPGGVYSFEVRAINGDLQSEMPAVLTFEVIPPFYGTWWFAILAIMALACAGAAIPVVRSRKIERERQRLELLVEQHTQELAEKNMKLQQSNRDLEHFAYVASHDLQEPLRKIQAFSDRITRIYSTKLDDQGRDYLSRMSGAASRMQRLIDDLLSLSRVSTKRNPIEWIDLNELATEVIGDLEFRVQSTGGRVDVGSLPRIVGDPVQIRQLFQNLIGNALKFHKPDVAPVVVVEAARFDGQYVELQFRDNGIGFDSSDAERVFLPFQRLHGRSQYEGTGIGLTIVQKIAERHAGSVRVESTPGVGSCFVLTLPVNGPSGEQRAA